MTFAVPPFVYLLCMLKIYYRRRLHGKFVLLYVVVVFREFLVIFRQSKTSLTLWCRSRIF